MWKLKFGDNDNFVLFKSSKEFYWFGDFVEFVKCYNLGNFGFGIERRFLKLLIIIVLVRRKLLKY